MQADEVGQPFHRDGWVYEEKYDGWRMVAYKDGTAVRLVSRAGKDHGRRFAEIAAAIRALPAAALILDGEVAIFDDRLVSRFEWFRKRPEDVASTPPIYMAFDCLYLEGRDLRPFLLQQRSLGRSPDRGSAFGGGLPAEPLGEPSSRGRRLSAVCHETVSFPLHLSTS
jgi:bifunctional non-homologous end joining protein LigD